MRVLLMDSASATTSRPRSLKAWGMTMHTEPGWRTEGGSPSSSPCH